MYTKGFSLAEMLISVAIIGLITAVIMARYDEFDDSVTLQNIAYEVALAAREAQVLGVSVRGVADSFGSAFGIHFELSNTYVIFQDLDDDGVYDDGEEVTVSTLQGGMVINDLCADADCTITELDITFERPNPDANIITTPAIVGVGQVRVEIASDNGNTADVVIRETGQISVE